MKRFFLLATLGLLVMTAAPAAAGGSAFRFDEASYRPGDRVRGWIEVYDVEQFRGDGPFVAWLTRPDAGCCNLPSDAVFVDELVLHEGRHRLGAVAPFHATVDFSLPDVPPGEYTLTVLDRATSSLSLADMTWGGTLRVRPGPPVTTTTAPPGTTATSEPVEPLVAESGGGGGGVRWGPLGLGLGGGLVLAAVVYLGWGRRQPTRKPA